MLSNWHGIFQGDSNSFDTISTLCIENILSKMLFLASGLETTNMYNSLRWWPRGQNVRMKVLLQIA